MAKALEDQVGSEASQKGRIHKGVAEKSHNKGLSHSSLKVLRLRGEEIVRSITTN